MSTRTPAPHQRISRWLAAVSCVVALCLARGARAQPSEAEPLPPLPPPSASPAPAPAPAPPTARPAPPPSPAPAPPPASASSGGAWRAFRGSARLAHSVPTAAVLEGAWSLSLHVNTELTNRTWDAPYPDGTIGQYSTRLLYGMSWTLMLGLESTILLAANQGRLDWLAEAGYRTDWIFAYDLPTCPSPGAFGGCGVGVGGFSYLSIRPRSSRFWFEAGGGWIQQRVLNDETRTVAESSWVLTPLTAIAEARTGEGPVELRLRGGPGVFFGMHNGHVHLTPRGERQGLDVPWHEMYPFDAGIGPGGRAEVIVSLFRHLSLDAEVVLAPFLLGRPVTQRAREIAPLDFPREGVSTWRRVTLGVGWDDPKNLPMKTQIAFTAAELSEAPISRFGYHAVLLRFDVPLRVDLAERD